MGGGFAGIKTALTLAQSHNTSREVTLISDKTHFEYHARLYHVLAGHTPLEVCVPLSEIFVHTGVRIVEDKIEKIDLEKQVVLGKENKQYAYDYLVMALGSENSYYDTPGLKELSYSVNSIESTVKLNKHLHDIFSLCKVDDEDMKNCSAHVVVVGGGATGCEVAGSLAVYARQIAKKHGIDESYVTIDLIHSGNRLMSVLPEPVSAQIKQRLYNLGVNIFLNRKVMKEEIENVYLKDMEMKSKTLIWCAGVKSNSLITEIKGISLDKRGKVIVNNMMQVEPYKNVYVAGDIASTHYSGMAQTAFQDGTYIGKAILAQLQNKILSPYTQTAPSYALPLGEKWAMSALGPLTLRGYGGWLIRRYFDLKAFLTILPWQKALKAFSSEKLLCEYCPICCELVVE